MAPARVRLRADLPRSPDRGAAGPGDARRPGARRRTNRRSGLHTPLKIGSAVVAFGRACIDDWSRDARAGAACRPPSRARQPRAPEGRRCVAAPMSGSPAPGTGGAAAPAAVGAVDGARRRRLRRRSAGGRTPASAWPTRCAERVRACSRPSPRADGRIVLRGRLASNGAARPARCLAGRARHWRRPSRSAVDEAAGARRDRGVPRQRHRRARAGRRRRPHRGRGCRARRRQR